MAIAGCRPLPKIWHGDFRFPFETLFTPSPIFEAGSSHRFSPDATQTRYESLDMHYDGQDANAQLADLES